VSAQNLAGMFWSRLEHSGAAPAQIVKRQGQWRTLGWSEVGEAVRELALGLLALGLRPGRSAALLCSPPASSW
jgi:long-chain acyl-CoA synthetase